MRASLMIVAFLSCFAATTYADDPNSVSDYYRATGRDPSLQQRAADFNKLRPGEKYTGSAEQNTLLHKTLRFGDQMAAQGEPSMGLFRSPKQDNGHSYFGNNQPSQNATLHRPFVINEGHRTSPKEPAPLTSFGESEEGIQPDWIDPIGMFFGGAAGRLGAAARTGASARPVPQRIDSGRLLYRSRMDPSPHHNFPGQLDEWIFEGAKQVKGPQYHLYTRPGTLNGQQGVYEIGVKPSATGKTEAVMHRLFRPDKK